MLKFREIRVIIFICFLTGAIQIIYSQKPKKIEIIRAGILEFQKIGDKDIRKLLNNVRLKHEQVIIDCDSAYFFSDKNLVNAFGEVHIFEKGKFNIYSKFLDYNGNTRIIIIKDSVRLIQDNATLYTDFFKYDRGNEIGSYLTGGRIVEDSTILISKKGYYYGKTKDYFFKDSVIIFHPDYTIFSDTLRYNSRQDLIFFFGPTEIITEQDYIYCETGIYNKNTDFAHFGKNSCLCSKENIVYSDSIIYNRETDEAKLFRNIELIDTNQNIIIYGDYAEFKGEKDYFMITQNALFVNVSDTDTLFLHADTLVSISIDTIDSCKILKAFYKVKIFKSDFQAKCDSLVYLLCDSVIRFFYRPVLWSQENQLTARYIDMFVKNNSIDSIVLKNTAFIISQEDSLRYNQISGQTIIGYFDRGELYKIYVTKNSQSIYFARDKDELVGVNKAVCDSLTIYRENGKVRKIVFYAFPTATLYPIGELSPAQLKLDGFNWQDNTRPKNKKDIFIWNE